MTVARLYDYTKKHWLYVLKRYIIRYVTYIPIKLLPPPLHQKEVKLDVARG